MKSAPVLKVLSNGWEVPYPEEAFFRNYLLLLKDYRLNSMPEKAWTRSFLYDEYVEWLQAYLFRCDEIDLMTWQSWIPARIATKRYLDCASIGRHAGFYESVLSMYHCYNFPENFEETFDIDHLKGTFDDDPYAEMLKRGLLDDDPPPDRLKFILQEYGGLLLKKKDEEQFQRYWPGFVKLEPLHWAFGLAADNLEPADSAWRVYLSLVLKRINNKGARIKALDRFFIEYEDIIHK
jgi:hypothetical protein